VRDSACGRILAKRWTVTRTLGVGGTGTVYEAVHRNGRRAAVKVLHPELANHPTIRNRFSSEGYAANRVRHPNAVAVLDDGEEADGTVYLVMELLEGQSLANLLSQRGALPLSEVVAAALSVLEVLAAAHDNGVVHRDVKPANIFATFDGRFKLLDFGVAQVAGLVSITQTGGTVGTPAFMAPEQAAGRVSEVDALTDIWAVGATMFQLLTKRLVHEASSHNGMLVAAATVPAPPIRSVAPSVPAGIARIVDRALAFERCERWPNARAMALALRTAYPEFTQVAFVEPFDPETVPEPQARAVERQTSLGPTQFRPWHPLLLLLIPLLLGMISLSNPRKPSPPAKLATQTTGFVAAPSNALRVTSAEARVDASAPAVRDAFVPSPASTRVETKATRRGLTMARKADARSQPTELPVTLPTDDDLLDRRK